MATRFGVAASIEAASIEAAPAAFAQGRSSTMALKLPPPLQPAAVNGVGSNHAPPYHGRRLIQMLFRSNNNNNNEVARSSHPSEQREGRRGAERDPEVDTRVEDSGALHDRDAHHHAGSTPGHPNATDPLAGKFHSLKRKLFPNRIRRHPIRIPPLVTSPIAVSSSVSLSPGWSEQDGPAAHSRSSNQAESNSHDLETVRDRASFCKSPLLSHRGGEEDDDEDADLELERAIEGLDADTGTEADTLEEMDRAIENLHKWKQVRLQETQDALRKIELDDAAEQSESSSRDPNDDEDANQLETAYETAILKTTIDEHDAARVAQVLLESHRLALSNDADVDAAVVTAAAGSDDTLRDSNSKASRLRDDIFDLSVRELSSTIQARLLLELEGTDSELGGEKHFQLLCCDC